MRSHVHILTICFFLFCGPAAASDVLLGTVVVSEPEKNEIVVRPVGVKTSAGKESEKDITVRFSADKFPSKLKAGETVRIWGDYHKKLSRQFNANKITPGSFRKPSKDPTGVRARLMRAQRPGRPPGPGGGPGKPGPRPGPGPGPKPGGPGRGGP